MRRNVDFSVALVAGLWLGAVSADGRAEILTFDYSGLVQLVGGKSFGTTVDFFSPVVGQFTVDTAAAASHSFDNGRIGYRQIQSAGFRATIGSGGQQLEVVASDYLTILGNDLDLVEKTVDIFEVVFANDFDPPLTAPLLVNGAAVERGDYNQDGASNALDYEQWKADFGQTGGLADGNGDWVVDAADYTIWRDGGPGGYFSIEFQNLAHDRFSSASLADANLAANLNLDGFIAPYNPLGDNNFLPTVLFAVTEISLRSAAAPSVAEPGGVAVIAAGMVSWLCIRVRFDRL